jgi:peptide/nickel transport system ATP-binding protein
VAVTASTPPLLEVRELITGVSTKALRTPILRGVSLAVARGEVLGLVGESGAGKSMFGISVMRLLEPPAAVFGGQVRVDGTDLLPLPDDAMRRLRGHRLSMVFQDPMTTLSPTHRVGVLMRDAIRAHRDVSAREAAQLSIAALQAVGIPSPQERLAAYPHQLSGGMRQRVCIAAAWLHDPQLVIADEPTTALDVTTQAQILRQVRHRRDTFGTGFVWITHDLGVVAQIADRIAVMYAGQVIEQASARELLARPRHPYTRALLDSIPSRNRGRARLPQVSGFAPRPSDVPAGCAFAARCARATTACAEAPPLHATGETGFVRCVRPLEAA